MRGILLLSLYQKTIEVLLSVPRKKPAKLEEEEEEVEICGGKRVYAAGFGDEEDEKKIIEKNGVWGKKGNFGANMVAEMDLLLELHA